MKEGRDDRAKWPPKQVQALLAQRRQVAADVAEGDGPRFAVEGARDLLLNFDHPNVTLRLVLVKRHDEVVHSV